MLTIHTLLNNRFEGNAEKPMIAASQRVEECLHYQFHQYHHEITTNQSLIHNSRSTKCCILLPYIDPDE